MKSNDSGTEVNSRLVVFSDDWGRHASSSQHLVRHFLEHHDVRWINTIGMRTPSLDAYALKRAFGKMTEWTGLSSVAKHNQPTTVPSDEPQAVSATLAPSICKPLMWPSFRTGWARRLNAKLLTRTVEQACVGSTHAVGLTTLPITADIVRADARRWVYYCVDDFSTWPGLDQNTLLHMERDLVEAADEIIVVSETLGKRIAAMGRDSTLLTHGVDLEHWKVESGKASIKLAGEPRVLFWGVLDQRLDMAWVRALSEALAGTEPSARITFVGPQNNPAAELFSLRNVDVVDALQFSELPALAAEADVLIMPYADLPVTRAMQPLKLKEYLATGKPVVIRALPATHDWADCCDAVTEQDKFVEMVLTRTREPLDATQSLQRQRLQSESWKEKAQVLERALFG